MYIDADLIRYLEKENFRSTDVVEVIEECGIWYSFEGVKAEWEDFDATLEEVMSEYYFVVDGNKIFFCSPEEFIDDCERVEVINGKLKFN